MKNHWWKLLGVILVVYGIVFGMTIPLRPNLVDVEPGVAMLDEQTVVSVVGYNTSFTAAPEGSIRAFLKGGAGLFLPSVRTEITDDRRATFTFRLPAALPERVKVAELPLLVSSPNDGTFVAPGAVTVRQDTAGWNAATATQGWFATDLVKDQFAANESITFPFRGLLAETIRNTYFHVSLWFAMLFLLTASAFQSVIHLIRSASLDRPLTAVTAKERSDLKAVSYASVGVLFGVLGLLTGALWARFTWGSWWNWDIKQFTTLIALLIYAGYFVLRAAFKDPEQRAKLSAGYNIFAFVCLIPLIYVIPRVSGNSLHPGAAGNPALGGEDLDNTMRLVFYPIIIGWTLMGFWMGRVNYRLRAIRHRLVLED